MRKFAIAVSVLGLAITLVEVVQYVRKIRKEA
jgi:hypothetical protein